MLLVEAPRTLKLPASIVLVPSPHHFNLLPHPTCDDPTYLQFYLSFLTPSLRVDYPRYYFCYPWAGRRLDQLSHGKRPPDPSQSSLQRLLGTPRIVQFSLQRTHLATSRVVARIG